MIIVDKQLKALEASGKVIRVGLIGAGFAGRGFALQLLTCIGGMKLVAISNRTIFEAQRAYQEAGVVGVTTVATADQLSKAVAQGEYAITSDPMLLCDSKDIDVIVEATGEVEFGAQVVMRAISKNKHVVLINAELDSTVGPILKMHADKAGVVYTQMDGDQPGVLMNLYRSVKFLGFEPVLAGNIKSLIDARRTPETQAAFAKAHFQRPKMITSFADGTKISMEMATVGNAMGFGVGKRGMYGPSCAHVEEAAALFSLEELQRGGIVDYILGAQPSFGVFILGYSDNPLRQRYMDVYKMGKGPLYTFYRPYHLGPLETHLTVARAALFGDAALAPLAGPVCDVITMAKRGLKKGEVLDGIGGFTCYGTIDNYRTSVKENLLPMGLSDGCVMKHDVSIDTAITYADVELPKGRLSDKLRNEQTLIFP